MKRVVSLVLSVLLLCAVGCGTAENTEETGVEESAEIAGGWSIHTGEAEGLLPQDVQNVFERATEGYGGVGFRPVAYLGSQVVAGMNYSVLCAATAITANPLTKLKVVILNEDLDGNASVRCVTDFNLGDYTNPDTEEEREALVAGGWKVSSEQPVTELPEEVRIAFEAATEGLTGAAYKPIAFLGDQIVAGMNYAVLCRQTLVTASTVVNLAVVTVYDPIEGKPSVRSIARLNLADFNN